MMLNSVKLITRAFSRPSVLHHQLKYVPYRGFADAHSAASTIFVGQIPRDVTEEELKQFFPTCLSTRIIKDRLSGSSKGFGFVDFPTHEEAKEAVSKTVEIFGHKLNLDFAAKNQFQKKLHARGIGDDEKSLTLFVGHLPYDMGEAELQSLFPGSVAVRILSDQSTGLSKGCAFVEFDTLEAAEEQFKNSGMEIRGQKLFVDFASNRKRSDKVKGSTPHSTLYVSNISYNTTSSGLAAAFSGCTKANIITHTDGRSKGFGFVEYVSVQEATEALDRLGNFELDGRILSINFATPRVKDVDEDIQQEPFELKDDLDSDMSWDDSLTEK
ncbi:nucleolin-like [Dysidea avara]|uniref:nucleolin-like n=1 Tax=Dysidea avara TaxID=196820 RepID=UPI00332A6068